ncbi:helix-turn-helix domain-containing protein [Kiritimatiellaeota bacterium B1221]|nr:helix-turn-helix domain-containing protein [Kiritimatiellaeota bacterium B1221]
MPASPESSTAPALERGLMILETLQASGPLSLDDLAAKCPIPKSSLLRLLSTLELRNYVQRRESDKKYFNRVSLIIQAPQNRSREEKIQFALESLSRQLGFTTEWYTPRKDHAHLTQRAESRDGDIKIRATLGFQRSWWEELDAVVRIVHAALPLEIEETQIPKFTRYQNGKLISHTSHSYHQAISTIDLDQPVFDAEYNANGIRRMAKGFQDANGKLLGILAVPMHFQPDADARMPEYLKTLQQCSHDLQTQLLQSP